MALLGAPSVTFVFSSDVAAGLRFAGRPYFLTKSARYLRSIRGNKSSIFFGAAPPKRQVAGDLRGE